MSDGSFSTTISAAGLAPAQRQQLEAELRSEGIPVTWLGETLHLDQAFESRVETLVAAARTVPGGPGAGPAPGTAPAPGFVPTVTVPRPAPAPPPYPTAGYPVPGYPATGYAPVPYYPRITNSNATLSLVLGIVGWFVCPLTAIFAITYGRRAQDEIDASGGTQTGEGMAKAGIVMGWVLIGLYGLMIVGFLVFIVLFSIIGVAASTA